MATPSLEMVALQSVLSKEDGNANGQALAQSANPFAATSTQSAMSNVTMEIFPTEMVALTAANSRKVSIVFKILYSVTPSAGRSVVMESTLDKFSAMMETLSQEMVAPQSAPLKTAGTALLYSEPNQFALPDAEIRLS